MYLNENTGIHFIWLQDSILKTFSTHTIFHPSPQRQSTTLYTIDYHLGILLWGIITMALSTLFILVGICCPTHTAPRSKLDKA